MKRGKVIHLLVIMMMFLSYLAPVSQVFASEFQLQVNMNDITKAGEQLNINFDVIVESSFVEAIDKIELIRNGEPEDITMDPGSINDTEDGEMKILSYTYLDNTNQEQSVDYSVIVTAGPMQVVSNVQTWNADGDGEPTGDSAVVEFEDPNLERAIREELWLEEGPITLARLQEVDNLYLSNYHISNLSGIENLVNLRVLYLAENPISSLEGILQLENLESLDVSNTEISSLNGIEKLPRLTWLNISSTQVNDLSPLLNAESPYEVNAYDIPLNFTGDEQAVKLLSQLNSKGFNIYYDHFNPIDLGQKIVSDTSVKLWWWYNNHEDGVSYQIYVDGVPQKERVLEGPYTITDLQPSTEYVIKIEVFKNGESTGESILTTVNTSAPPSGEIVTFEDANLTQAVRESLSIFERDLKTSDMENLFIIDAHNSNIKSLSGLQSASNLRQLFLNNNAITDIASLKSASNLYTLYLADNPIEDISVLSFFKELKYLNLSGTNITDIQVLLELPYLEEVLIERTAIDYETDQNAINVIEELEQRGIRVEYKNLGYISVSDQTSDRKIHLTWEYHGEKTPDSYTVYLNGEDIGTTEDNEFVIDGLEPETRYDIEIAAIRNGQFTEEKGWSTITTQSEPTGEIIHIEDSALVEAIREQLWIFDRELQASDLEELTYLDASSRSISSLEGLQYAKNLRSIDLGNNHVTDLSPIKGLQQLEYLNVSWNPITSVDEISGLENLTSLYLYETALTDISALASLPSLEYVNIEYVNIDFRNDQASREVIKELTDKGVEVYFIHVSMNAERAKATQDAIHLKWSIDEEETEFRPTSFKIYLNGEVYDETTSLEYIISGLNPETEYEVRVVGLWEGIRVTSSSWYITTGKVPTGDVVEFEDEALEGLIREELLVFDRDLQASDLESLIYLEGQNKGISSLKGLEYAINLREIYLAENAIDDLTPIKDLTELRYADLSGNPISDLLPLKGLQNLYYIYIQNLNIDYNNDELAIEVIRELMNNGTLVYFSDVWVYTQRPQVTQDSITLRWSLGNEDSELAPTSYKVYLDDQEITETTDMEYTFSGLKPETEYAIKLVGIWNGIPITEDHRFIVTSKIPSGETIQFEDSALEELIRAQLGIYDREIVESDMEELYELDGDYSNVQSLTGLEYAHNLEFLYLGGNQISDLSPLADLNNLYFVNLSYNPISDISALKDLNTLGSLNLSGTAVSELSTLLNLTGLNWLGVKNVDIDYAADQNAMSVINELMARGVEVSYKDLGNIWINKAKASDKSIYLEWEYDGYIYETGEELKAPASYKIFVNDVEAAEVSESSFTIENLEHNTEYKIRIEGFTNGSSTGEYTTEIVSTVMSPTGEVVQIADSALEEVIREELWVYDRALRESDLERLTYLDVYYQNISSLSGLEKAINLEGLTLYGNYISDLGPIGKLEKLSYLSLGHNRISDISQISGLSSLKSLGLQNNQIIDISPLEKLVNLESLSLWGNRITDISAISKLTRLQDLDLENNLVKDLTPLKDLMSLDYLYLSNNPVSNLEPLKGLTSLNSLYLWGTPIDLSPGSSAMQVIDHLRENDVRVEISEGYFEEIWMDIYDVTDTSAAVNWYGNIDPSVVSSANITVYAFENDGWDVTDDVYRDVYSDVYGDVYEKGSVEAVHEVNYSDFNYKIDGLKPATSYAFVMDVTLKDEKSVSSQSYVTTKWSSDQLVDGVSFKVVDQDGKIVPNAEISIEGVSTDNKDVFLYGFTNSEGLFQSLSDPGTNLALPEGEYYVYILGGGKYENDYQVVQVTKDGVYPIEIQAKKIEAETAIVTLKVTDDSGNPITSLEYISFYSQEITNRFGYDFGAQQHWNLKSTDGSYIFDGLTVANDYLINLESKDFKVWSDSNISVKKNGLIEVVLDKGAVVKAEVKSQDGKALTGANFSIFGNSSNAYGTIDQAGTLNKNGLNVEDLTLEIYMPGYLTYTKTIKAEDFIDGVADIGEIILEPEQVIKGYVYKTKVDEPVKHASVMLYAEGQKYESYWTRTDDKGFFEIRNVKPGSYKVKAEAYNMPTAEAEVAAGGTIELFLTKDAKGAFAGEGNSFAPSKTSAVPGETIEYRLNYSNNSATSVNNVDVNFTLLDGVELISESILVSSKKADVSKFASTKAVKVSDVQPGEKGTISFKVKVKEEAADNINASASVITADETVTLNSSISLTYVTLHGPEVTAESKVKVYGSGKSGSTVKVYDGDKLLAETKVPINSKWWYADVQLPVQSGTESKHQLVAKATSNDITASSAPISIQYKPSVPKLKDISITAGWNKDVKLNPYTGVATMAIVEFTPIKLTAQFDQSIDKASLKFLGESYAFIKKGDYYEATVPGTWSSYGEQLMELSFEKGDLKINMPILEVIVLIDPSGYVFEGSMSNRLSGATAVVEEQQANGSWKPWNAAAFGQVNPQVTDEDGRYGWDVIQGAWRVIFSKEDYVKYTSRTVYVPPAETELNVPMVRTTLPIVEQTSVVDGAEDVAADSSIDIIFDRLMNEETAQENISIVDPKGNTVKGTLIGKEHYFGYKTVENKPGFYEEDQSKLLSQTYTWKADTELAGGEYQLVIASAVTDYSGKKMENDKAITFSVKGNDTTAPVVEGVQDGEIYNENVTISFNEGEATLNGEKFTSGTVVDSEGDYILVVTDPSGNKTTVTFTIDKTAPKVTGVANNGLYNTDVTITFSEGEATLNEKDIENGTQVTAAGTYTLVVTDEAGNKTTVSFTIDKTAPVVTGVANNGLYNTDVTITFSEGEATLNNKDIENGTKVTAAGIYTLVVTDEAGNSTKLTFTIDKSAPAVTGVINNGFYNKDVKVTFNEGKATLNGKVFTSGTVVKAAGVYTLIVTDPAGNKTTIKFTIDKTAPKVTGITNNSYYNKDIKITFNEGKATLNGKIISNGYIVKTAGTFTLIVTDAAGNKVTVKFTIDKKAPGIPKVYSVTDKSKEVTGVAEKGSTVAVKIGKKKYYGKADAKGKFKVKIPKQKAGVKLYISAMDTAKNASKSKKVTVLDKTAPKTPKVKTVKSSSKVVTGSTEAYAKVTVKVGKKTIGTAKADKKGNFKVKIKAQKKKTTLSVTAKDKAGNTSKAAKVKVK